MGIQALFAEGLAAFDDEDVATLADLDRAGTVEIAPVDPLQAQPVRAHQSRARVRVDSVRRGRLRHRG